MTAIATLAHALAEQHISAVPIRPDGSKAPATPWRSYQHKTPTHRQIDAMFQPEHGIAVVGGRGLEVLDHDEPSLVEPWQQRVEMAAPGLVGRLAAARTPDGGMHFYYRHTGPDAGNLKLAMEPRGSGQHTLIETRGRGGYAIVHPSPGACHPSGRPYVMVQGDLLAIPTLDATEREVLLSTARQFNLCRIETTAGTQPQTAPGPPSVRRGDRPGDHFNARMTWATLLQKHGWRIERTDGVTTYWSRPGKERGVSASTNYGGCDLLYVFSTNAAPFDHERAYDKFGAYALLEHGGDFSAASRALALAGYSALSLAQVVGLVVPLTKGRGYLAGTCPFCGCRDKLGVFPREDFFRCFACGVQGNGASFRALLSTQLRAQRRGG